MANHPIPMFAYPALFACADRLAVGSQRQYLWLVRSEYALLIAAAGLAYALSFLPVDPRTGARFGAPATWLYAAYVFAFIVSLGVMFTRSLKKPEQDWYRARALAESIKTSCWRYAMRADPFGDVERLSVRQGEFRDYLRTIVAHNRAVSVRLPPDDASAEQITASMEAVRALDLRPRQAHYLEHRILEQRTWYQGEAAANKRASGRWFALGIATYALILLLVVGGFPTASEPGAVGILVVVATSLLGWVQIRKFNELVSTYTLTSLEIGIIQHQALAAKDEAAFSAFVNEAERAFSREHTQWIARGGG